MSKLAQSIHLLTHLRKTAIKANTGDAALLAIALAALKKQESLPPSRNIDLTRDTQRRMGVEVYHCPTCLTPIINHKPGHCDTCGQALTWTQKEELLL